MAQSMHTDACVREKEPVLQGMHVELSDAPVVGDAVPAGHGVHVCVVKPFTVLMDENVPVGHCSACSWVSTVWLTTPTKPVAP